MSLGRVSRRGVLGLLAVSLAGCVTDSGASLPGSMATSAGRAPNPILPAMYRGTIDGGVSVPEVDIGEMDPKFFRQEVECATKARPGTLVVDTPSKFLFHVKAGGRATRYGVGVGREGFAWSGNAVVAYGRRWPRWVPPDAMVQRQPELKRYSAAAGGMAPGLGNPLGARAMYIHDRGRDTLYRLHGTNDPASIGKAVSSGCVRLLNQDVMHLFDNVRNGTPIVVIPDLSMSAA